MIFQLMFSYIRLGQKLVVVHSFDRKPLDDQAGRDIHFLWNSPCRLFLRFDPCARSLTKDDRSSLWKDAQAVIVRRIWASWSQSCWVPGIVVRNHGPFTWGKNPECCLSLCRIRGSIKGESLYRANQSRGWTCSQYITKTLAVSMDQMLITVKRNKGELKRLGPFDPSLALYSVSIRY